MTESAAPAPRGRSSSIALAALAFALVAPLAYLAQRLYDYASVGSPDPLAMIRTTVVTYYWRCAIAAFWGGLAAIAVLTSCRSRGGTSRRPLTPSGGALRRLAISAALLAVAFAVLAWRFP